MSDGTDSGQARPGVERIDAATFKHEIAADMSISGRIDFPGNARIDGRLKGEIRAHALLFVSESGLVNATVRARELVVRGSIEGDVRQAHRVEILPGGRVIGGVEAELLVVHPGAALQGRCAIGAPQSFEQTRPRVVRLERAV